MYFPNRSDPTKLELSCDDKSGKQGWDCKKKKDENDRIYKGVVQKNYTTRLKFNGSNEKWMHLDFQIFINLIQ